MVGYQQDIEQVRQLERQGKLAEAERTCRLLTNRTPNAGEAWLLLGNLCRDLGKNQEAVSAYRSALLHSTRDEEVLNSLGVALATLGSLDEAVRCFEDAIEVEPRSPQAHHNLGVAVAQRGKHRNAEKHFQVAVELKADYAEGLLNLAVTLSATGKSDQAIIAFKRAVKVRPAFPDALNGLGLALINSKRPADAIIPLQQAVRLRPDFNGAWNNLGLAFFDEGNYEDAEAAFQSALSLNPRSTEAHSNLGNLFKELKRLTEAIAHYDVAVNLDAQCVSARWNRSLALLQSGDFEKGWPEYETRWRRKSSSAPRLMSFPSWDGSNLSGRSILVHCEQGLGDVLQFVRYTAMLQQRGATVIFEVPSPLMGVLSSCKSIDQLVPETHKLQHCDCHVSVMSLPYWCGTRLNTIPADVPYLFVNEGRLNRWRRRLDSVKGFKVGIAWQGNPHHQWDAHRSVHLSHFADLAKLPGVSLVSIQRGPGSEQSAVADFPLEDPLPRNASDSDSVMDVAAIMSCVDLVITVDTATCHLAGALGLKTWLLLSTMVDWRWLLDRSDSPWYPTMQLFRQEARGDWEGVFATVASQLKAVAAQFATRGAPDQQGEDHPSLSPPGSA